MDRHSKFFSKLSSFINSTQEDKLYDQLIGTLELQDLNKNMLS